jgi:predicted nicotinamide N-methyase
MGVAAVGGTRWRPVSAEAMGGLRSAARLCLLVMWCVVLVDGFCDSSVRTLSMAVDGACNRAAICHGPSARKAECTSRDWHTSEEVRDNTCTRSVFNRATVGAFTLAAGTLLFPACAPASAARGKVPKFIDVAVDLGQAGILNVRQPYGLPPESKADREGGGDRQGTYVWPASTDLAKFLVSDQGKWVVRGKRVVELGAGTAISGLAASIAGATCVAFTDGSPEVLEVTRDTVQRNGLRLEPNGQGRQCLVERLRWGNQQDVSALLAKSRGGGARGYDVVLGAEITYLSASIDPLFDSIFALLSTSPMAQQSTTSSSIRALGEAPVALLTFTPELTCFDGGGVKELETKAGKHGLSLKYLDPPPNNPDPDTLLVALTLHYKK